MIFQMLQTKCLWRNILLLFWGPDVSGTLGRLLADGGAYLKSRVYTSSFFFFFSQEGHLWKFPFLGQCTGNEYPPEVTWMLAWADSLLEPLAQSHCFLSCYPKSNLKIQTQVCSQHQGKNKQKTAIKTISTSLAEQEVIAPIEDVDA